MRRQEPTRRKEYQWFVEPKDAHTNQVIARDLAEMINVSDSREVPDDLGEMHNVYQVNEHKFITELNKARIQFSLDFAIFSPLNLIVNVQMNIASYLFLMVYYTHKLFEGRSNMIDSTLIAYDHSHFLTH